MTIIDARNRFGAGNGEKLTDPSPRRRRRQEMQGSLVHPGRSDIQHEEAPPLFRAFTWLHEGTNIQQFGDTGTREPFSVGFQGTDALEMADCFGNLIEAHKPIFRRRTQSEVPLVVTLYGDEKDGEGKTCALELHYEPVSTKQRKGKGLTRMEAKWEKEPKKE